MFRLLIMAIAALHQNRGCKGPPFTGPILCKSLAQSLQIPYISLYVDPTHPSPPHPPPLPVVVPFLLGPATVCGTQSPDASHSGCSLLPDTVCSTQSPGACHCRCLILWVPDTGGATLQVPDTGGVTLYEMFQTLLVTLAPK